jgi:xanthine dehydrogenase molybdopterin-binding subunit B
VRQAVAFSLSPLWNKRKDVDIVSKIRVLQQDSLSLPNTFCDGGSTTSEGSCAAASQACEVLVQRLLPIKAKLGGDEVSWENLCDTARKSFVDLQAHVLWTPPPAHSRYILFGAGVSEVEINVLSGETRILRSDIVYDAGKTLNAAVDVGQVEGAFVMGIGYYLTEDIERDNEGKLLSDGTWTYKPPTIDNIPQKLNVELFNSPAHKDRVFSSKAVGEPPLLLAGSVYAAIHQAIAAARKDYLGPKFAGRDAFEFNPPATIQNVKALCGFDNVERYIESQLQTALKAPHGKLL